MSQTPVVELPAAVDVINIGLPLFESALRDQGRPVIGVDWRIPGGGEARTVAALSRLLGPQAARIDQANAEVLRRLNDGVPLLVGIDRAGAVIPGMGERDILHCGPSIAWQDMPDPLQRSVRAAVVAEGWAPDVEAAGQLVESGDVRLAPANEHRTVVPMATSIGPSAPVYVVQNELGGVTAYSSINQGSGAVQWFGVDSDAAIDRIRFVRDKVGPVLAEALSNHGPVDAFALAAQGVPMGDDVHMRVQATTNLFLRDLLPYLVRGTHPATAEVATFLSGNHLMFLNVAMAAAKSLVEWAGEVRESSIVTTMARNGTTYGVRLAGSGDDWFLAPSPPIQDALYYPGFGPETSAPDIGDSAVLELVGLGGPAAANSPAVAGFLGGRMSHAIAATRSMQRICAGESPRFRLPILDNVGTPVGVDVRKVVELGITPAVNTGIIHATAGTGQVGAGVAWAPIECFTDALLDLDRRLAPDA
ncbi:DUF1116 domain-containing protein [Kribbella pittospori]|uniref:DUF1116 domain-containing protein n=1 Tax=Kribbella pittospori TaxID=722689 RepID=A0A4R0KPL0_9ACTN|nr:DUF1116 domain-containing protein [Kribbella pittospori]TCC62319.1 DUF1116 domain-containing protein [Kribbella pittospori]